MSVSPKLSIGIESQTHAPAGTRRGALTWRSALIGLGGVTLLSAITPYNDYHLHQTYLYGNHFPVGCLFLFIVIVLVVNTLLRLLRPASALAQIELLTIWAMFITGSGFASSGLMRYLGPIPVAPYYFANETNRWAEWARAIPHWMVPSTDGQGPVVKWFFEGVPPGASIPWQPWVGVSFVWGLLFLLVAGFSVFACALARKQWVDRERLVFPLVFIPIEMSRDPQQGAVNSFFRSKLMWTGAALAFTVHLLNGLHHYYFAVPEIPIRWEVWQMWRDPPWNALTMWSVPLYFSAVGLGYLLPCDVSLSIWVFFVLFRLQRVLRVSMGMDTLSSDVPNNEVAVTVGGFVVWGIWLLWVSRNHLKTIWQSLFSGSAKDENEPIPLRISAIGAVVCFMGIVLWTRATGVSTSFALALWGIFVLILLILTRIVAESGLLMVQTPFIPTDVLSAVPGSRMFNFTGLGPAMMSQIVWMHDPREAYMPSVMNALRLKSEDSGRGLLAGVLLATVVGFVVSFVSFIYVSYTYGGVTLDAWGNRACPLTYYAPLIRYIDTPTRTNWAVVQNMGLGGLVSAFLLVMRKNYVWWGLQPIGFVLAPTYAVLCVWFSVFVAWLCKRLAMFCGYKTYRTLLPVIPRAGDRRRDSCRAVGDSRHVHGSRRAVVPAIVVGAATSAGSVGAACRGESRMWKPLLQRSRSEQ